MHEPAPLLEPKSPRWLSAWSFVAATYAVLLSVGTALFLASQLWTFERLLAVEGDRPPLVPDWFLWVTPDGESVARKPGGDPLAGDLLAGDLLGGAWTLDRRGSSLRGAPSARQRATARPWIGFGAVGSDLAVRPDGSDGAEWLEFLRVGQASDFARLGNEPKLAGWWRTRLGVDPEEFRFEPDGVLRDASGRVRGRWAGDGWVVLVYHRGWQRRGSKTFLRITDDDAVESFLSIGEDPAILHRVRRPLIALSAERDS